jgi:hypothetical protein
MIAGQNIGARFACGVASAAFADSQLKSQKAAR